jgi:hypothetical protein
VQERALAAAGFARQRDALARGDRQVHTAQHRDLFAGCAVALGQAGHMKHAGIAVGHARRWTDLTMKIPWRDGMQHIRAGAPDHGLNRAAT